MFSRLRSLLLVSLVLVLNAVRSHFFESLSVCGTDEVGLHVVNSALRVHQVLVVLSFDLNHAHDNAIDHVDGLTFIFFAFSSFLVSFDSFSILHLMITLAALIFVENTVMYTRASLVENASV